MHQDPWRTSAPGVKIGPVPGAWTRRYRAAFLLLRRRRGYERAKLDVRDDEGREHFSPWRPSPMSWSRASGRESWTVSASATDQWPPATPASCTARRVATDRRPPLAWAGHDLDYLAVSGYLAMSAIRRLGAASAYRARRLRTQPQGACTRHSRSWRALLARHANGKGAISTWRWPTVRSGSCLLRSTSTSRPEPSPEPGHDVLSGRYACYANYQARTALRRGGSDRAQVLRQPLRRTRVRRLGRASVRRRRAPDRDPGRIFRRVRHAGIATAGSR